jgi:DMSO reductase anchor subunit
MYVVLPPVLLSMLAANSPFCLGSAEVLRRIAQNKRACLMFYAATFVVYTMALGIGYSLLLIPIVWPIYFVGVVLVIASFLVARLIGRLGWVLGQTPDEDDVVGHAPRAEEIL